jgi:hypothetical protein
MIVASPLPETIRGLPLHVLVVHAVVVLVPLVAFGAILIGLWPAVRRHFGALLVLVGLAATVLVPVATGSGENLRNQLQAGDLVHNHAKWADRMLPTMIVLTVSILVLVLLDILRRTTSMFAGDDYPGARGAGAVDADPIGGSGSIGSSGPIGRGGAGTATLAAPAPTAEQPLTVVDRWVGARLPRQLRTAAAEIWTRRAEAAFAVLCIVLALVALYVCFQTGESGAKAVWSTH